MGKWCVGLLVGLVCLSPLTAEANDYLSDDANDWYRYRQAQSSGPEVMSQITQDLGGWRMWSEFGGLGPTWVYTSPNHDWFWMWNGTTYTLVGNLSGRVGDARTVDMPPCNRGRATIAWQGDLATPAGTFPDTTKIAFQTSCADAGTTAIWFAKGVGIVKWTESSFAGERSFELTSARVDGRTHSASSAPTTSSAPSNGRPVAPTEHDVMESILWGSNDTYLVVDTYRDAFRGLHGHLASQVIVSSRGVASQLRYEMAQSNVSLDDVELLVANLDSIWMRDYGPIILKRPNGQRVVADLDYYPGRPNDNAFPAAYASYRGWSRVRVRVSYEGGNFATDGQGTMIASRGVQWFNQDLSRGEIERRFRDLGSDQVLWVDPLINEGTTHIDMFLRLMSDDDALVSSYPSSHRQYRVTNDAAAALRGLGYQVTRVPVHHSYDEYATYSNSVLANGVALVPQYGSATKDRDALRAYQALGFQAVGIDSRLIIRYSGATHCISMQVPAGR